MPESNELRKKVLLRSIGSPWVVGPLLIGITALTASWALAFKTGLGLFIGLAGMLGAVGAWVTRFMLAGERLTREVMQEMDQSRSLDRKRRLDALDQHLAEADDDPRPEVALRDLRALVKAFDEAENHASPSQLATLIEIRSRVHELFDHCVTSLEETDRLWSTARQLHISAARKALMDQREQIVADVQATVKKLSQTLVGVQTLGTLRQGSSPELGRLRSELDQSLKVARQVEERLQTLLQDPLSSAEPSRLTVNPETKG